MTEITIASCAVSCPKCEAEINNITGREITCACGFSGRRKDFNSLDPQVKTLRGLDKEIYDTGIAELQAADEKRAQEAVSPTNLVARIEELESTIKSLERRVFALER